MSDFDHYNPALGDINAFLKKHQKLVRMVVKRSVKSYGNSNEDDLHQEGMLGLMRAYRTYNPDKGAFSTHAVINIKYKVMNYVRDRGHIVRPPRWAYELAGKIIKLDLVNESDEAIRQAIKCEPEMIEAARALITNPVALSLNRTIDEEESTTLEDMIGHIDDQTAVDVEEFMNTLDERERQVLELKMLGYVQKDIGKEVGVSQVQIGRILKCIGVKYRRFIGGVDYAICRD